MPAVKLAIIGGGSAYAVTMLKSMAEFAKKGSLAGSEVVLMDINRELAKLNCEFAQHVIKHEGVDLKVSTAGTLADTLPDSDFVLNTFRVGGLDGRYLDETIPLKYGLLGQETTGIGGLFMALRTIPQVLDVADAMSQHCPGAWMVNYTNPTNMVVDAALKHSSIKTLGLCDGVYGIKWLIQGLLGLPIERAPEVEAYVGGINHCTWSLKIQFEGRDIYAELPELVKDPERVKRLDERLQDVVELYKYMGIMPGSAYYTEYYYMLNKTVAKFQNPEFQHRSQWLKEKFTKIRAFMKEQMKSKKPSWGEYDAEQASHGDQAIGAINSIANDTHAVEVVNMPNNGAVRNLPDSATVEVTAVMMALGPVACTVGPLPKQVYGMVRSALDHSELVVEAAVKGDRKLVMQAAMAHPTVRDYHVAEKVIEELFAAHREWLPRFKVK